MMTRKQFADVLERLRKLRQYGKVKYCEYEIYQILVSEFTIVLVAPESNHPGIYGRLTHENFKSEAALEEKLNIETTMFSLGKYIAHNR